MMIPLVDTHAHLYSEEFEGESAEVLMQCRQAGVGRILLPNLNTASLEPMNHLVEASDGLCLPMIGLHPTEFGDDYERELEMLEYELRRRPSHYIAIGEIGLDYYWSTERKPQMHEALRRQLKWAAEFDLPVSLHARSATMDVVKLIREVGAEHLRGVFHSFTDTADELRAILELPHFMVGINGVVTFKNSGLGAVIRGLLPIERLVVETDSPYLSPVPKRGRRNDSSHLPYIVSHLATLYDVPEEQLRVQLLANSKAMFGDMI